MTDINDMMQDLCISIIDELDSDELIYNKSDETIEATENGFKCIGFAKFRMGRGGGKEPKFMDKPITDDENAMREAYKEKYNRDFDDDIQAYDGQKGANDMRYNEAEDYENDWDMEDGQDFSTSDYHYIAKVERNEKGLFTASLEVDNWEAQTALEAFDDITKVDFTELVNKMVSKVTL